MVRYMVKESKCNGIRKTWPWKGYPCCNKGEFKFKGKLYCAVHYGQLVGKKVENDRNS